MKKKRKQKKITKPDKRLMRHVGKSVTIPTFVLPENGEAFKSMIEWCLNGDFANHGSYTTFAEANGITRRTLYNWLRAEETHKIMDEAIEAQVAAEKPRTRQIIQENMAENAAYARLYMERYEKWSPEQPKIPAIQINFNFLKPGTAPDKPAIEADFEEVPS